MGRGFIVIFLGVGVGGGTGTVVGDNTGGGGVGRQRQRGGVILTHLVRRDTGVTLMVWGRLEEVMAGVM